MTRVLADRQSPLWRAVDLHTEQVLAIIVIAQIARVVIVRIVRHVRREVLTLIDQLVHREMAIVSVVQREVLTATVHRVVTAVIAGPTLAPTHGADQMM